MEKMNPQRGQRRGYEKHRKHKTGWKEKHRHQKEDRGVDFKTASALVHPLYTVLHQHPHVFSLFYTKKGTLFLTKTHWFIWLKQEVLFPFSQRWFSLRLLQVSAATKVPKRLEMSEWSECQDGADPFDSSSSSVQCTDRRWRWEPTPPEEPEEPGPPVLLLAETSASGERNRTGKNSDGGLTAAVYALIS